LQQILQAVNTIHEERIVHSDLKPANFLLVKGSLKLIDFGIAKAIMSDTTNIQRESQVLFIFHLSSPFDSLVNMPHLIFLFPLTFVYCFLPVGCGYFIIAYFYS
jgi:serine/threonine protein kinase